jgi:hypothetical protein
MDNGEALTQIQLGVGDAAVSTSSGQPSAIPDASLYIRDLAVLAGDYNGDGRVDAADYVVWRKNLGATSGPGLAADGNGNGTVDGADYALWRSNFGATASGRSRAPTPRGLVSGPSIEVLDQGVTPSGDRSFLLRVRSDVSADSYAVRRAGPPRTRRALPRAIAETVTHAQ